MSAARRLQQSTPRRTAPSSNIQKLESYSDTMAAYASSKEKEGKMNEAASYFLKAADILLVVCRDPNIDYPTWLRLSEKASVHHKKVKMLLANHRRLIETQQNPQ